MNNNNDSNNNNNNNGTISGFCAFYKISCEAIKKLKYYYYNSGSEAWH